jgi:hypothetical protein
LTTAFTAPIVETELFLKRRNEMEKLRQYVIGQTESLSEQLNSLEPSSKEYEQVLGRLETFVRLRLDLVVNNLKPTPSVVERILANPALVGVLGNLALTLLILNYERTEVITSRAFSFIRPK